MKRRILSVFLALALMLSMMGTTVFAAEADLVVAVQSTEAPLVENSIVSVPVTFTRNNGVALLFLQVNWDETALELTDITFHALDDLASTPVNEAEGGTCIVFAGDPLAAQNYTGTGEAVFTLKFKILAAAETKSYDITMNAVQDKECLNSDIQPLNVAFTNGTVTLTESANTHLQWVEDDSALYSDTNLWPLLSPETQYHNGSIWKNHAKVTSVTIPVNPGDRIWASSFQSKAVTGGSSNGIAVAFFHNNTLVKFYGTNAESENYTYGEFVEKGYLEVPEGANAVCIPMWNANGTNELYILTLPKRIASAELAITAPETGNAPETELSGEGFTGEIIWSPAVDGKFAANQIYTAAITLTAQAGSKFPADFTATVNGEAVSFTVNAAGTAATGSVTFAETTMVEIAEAELTVAAPVTGAAPQTSLAGEGFTGEIVWSPAVDDVFAPRTVYTAGITLTAMAGEYKFASSFTANVNGKAVTFELNAEGATATGSLTFAATEAKHSSHVQQIPDGTYADDNLWTILTPENVYYKSADSGWSSNYHSVTFPVQAGDQIYASSFKAKGQNGSAKRYGIVVTFFDEKGDKLKVYSPADTGDVAGSTYAEYIKNGGYLIAPEGAAFVNIPMWKDDANSVVNLLTLPKRITSAELTITVPETGNAPETELSGEGFTGEIVWSPAVDGKFAANQIYTAAITLTAEGKNKIMPEFTATVNGETVSFTVNDEGTAATGSIAFESTGEPLNSHLQWVAPGTEVYNDTNLWTLLAPKKEYHNGTEWKYTHATVYSITIPVKPGDRIWANSFGAKPGNEGTSNGIAVTFFYGDEIVKKLGTSGENTTYAEFAANGYITVPEGANAVCIPVWKNNENAVVKLLTLPERPAEVLIGDVDNNGEVTLRDAMILIRHVNNWPDAGVVSMEAANVDVEGDVTLKDAMILLRYVNGWPGYDSYFD